MKTKLASAKYSENNWSSFSKENSVITIDDIIDAYQEGCKDGVDNYVSEMKQKLKGNLQTILPILEKFFNEINKSTNTSNLMMLKLADINRFKCIIALDSRVYSDDALCRPIYEKSFDLKHNNPNVDISFMPFSGDVNKEALRSDNYLLHYGSPS